MTSASHGKAEVSRLDRDRRLGTYCGHRGTQAKLIVIREAIHLVVWRAMGNEMTQESIAAAGNTEVPAYLALIELGYSVDRVEKDGEEHWIAKKGTLQLMADCPLELLGLSLLRSERGSRWQAGDNEIDEFLKRFYPSARRP